MGLDAVQIFFRQLGTLGQFFRAAVGNLANQQLFQPREYVVFHDAHLIDQILLVAAQLVVDDLLGALVALQTFAG